MRRVAHTRSPTPVRMNPPMNDLPPLTRESQWTCRICGCRFPVPMLARDCEEAHDGE